MEGWSMDDYFCKKAIAIDKPPKAKKVRKDQLGYRVDEQIKKAFDDLCEMKGYNQGKQVELFMIKFIEAKTNKK